VGLVVADPAHQHLAQRSHDSSVVPEHGEAESWLETFQALAKELQVDIVVGTIVEKSAEEVEGKPQGLYNVANYVSKTGEVIGRYKKRSKPSHPRHLPTLRTLLTAGPLCRPVVAREGELGGACDRARVAVADADPILQDYLTAGEQEDHVAFDTDHGKAGMLVCWDMAWSEAFRSVSPAGPNSPPYPEG
jgi:predicted amidohydrolase